MNGNSSNQDSYDYENLFGMRKTTYWEIYGVKRFPYRGRRRFTPLLCQSSDGGMIISNDVFGLTIKQFERMFEACLDKRKKHEQWILNLRYPDKSSNDYLEYLQSCTDCNKDHLVLLGNDQRQKYLYEHLVKTVGTEIDIRKRQRLFIIQDLIRNVLSTDYTQISSGSLAEGLDLPGSDLDIMFVIHDVDVIHNVSNIKQPIHRTTYVIETDIDHPGFARLRMVASKGGESIRVKCPSCPPGTCTGERIYASVNRFRDYHKQTFDYRTMEVHGPCLSDPSKSIDNAFCLRRKINQSNNKMLIPVLESIKSGGIDGLIKNLFLPDDRNYHLLKTHSESSSIMLDFIFYRSSGSFAILADISSWYKCLAFTKSLLKSESSAFIIDVCTYNYAEICKYVAQLLPSPNTIGNTYNIRKCYHRHLQYGIKTDAVSGWLLYASFYYVTGQFNVTLRLTDYILSRCSPDMLYIEAAYGCEMCEVHTNGYRQNVHSTMTLNDRIKMATVNAVQYCQHSSLIPEELQMEVKERRLITFTPFIMAHCLRFLSYHHLDDIFNRQRALRNLYLKVKNTVLIPLNTVSDSLTILGVCCEISGDKDAAYQCYEEALQCDCVISSTAEQRKSKLDGN
ncbi:unnamed protein product [Mytilus coruscus]|uniref:Uncharacterized protein n=1 Tax=Mytilus coruscus TaxID=42192 RepID=A0A6J8F2N1_MYTCO|nr:unnamed protein product [Mytilus coruscus]